MVLSVGMGLGRQLPKDDQWTFKADLWRNRDVRIQRKGSAKSSISVGCLIEAPGLYGNMTAYENLNIKCKLFGIKKTGYIEEILRIVGLEDVGKKQTKHFPLE